jgi:hypothetical protein
MLVKVANKENMLLQLHKICIYVEGFMPEKSNYVAIIGYFIVLMFFFPSLVIIVSFQWCLQENWV